MSLYKEFAYANTHFHRNIIEKESYEKEFIAKHKNDSCYSTFASYDRKDQETAIITAPYIIDIDKEEDVESAKMETKQIVALLNRIGVTPLIYFSGLKGFHIEVPFECWGIQPSFHIIDVFKELTKNMVKSQGLKNVDLKVYERKRVFRINNTKHFKSGLYKIQLKEEELDLTVNEIIELAKNKRCLKSSPDYYKFNKTLKGSYLQAEKMYFSQKEKKNEHKICSIDSIKLRPCVKAILENGVDEGNRNDICYNLSLFFKSQNLPELDAMRVLHGFSGLGDKEIESTVKSAYRSSFKWGCNENELIQQFCDKDRCVYGYQRKTITDLVWSKDDLIKELEKEERGEYNTSLTFGLKEMDNAWNGIRKDELITLVADSGIGKTSYAFWMAKKNAEMGNRVLFCSLEMATSALLSRATGDLGMDFKQMKSWIADNPIYFYKDGQRLSTKNLRINLENSIKQDFGIDLIIIDHLGYVEKPSDKIYESISTIAEELSNFCKDLSIPVLLLHHYTKGSAGASEKPRSVNDVLGSGRLRDFSSKLFQIWYPKKKDGDDDKLTAFIMEKNRYGGYKTVKAFYESGEYKHDLAAEIIDTDDY